MILVDDRSTDATGDIARSIAAVHVVRIDSYEPGRLTARQVAIDAGVHAARGQIIVLAYIDAYTKMVTQLGGLPDNAAAAAPRGN